MQFTSSFLHAELRALTRIEAPIERAWSVLSGTDAWSRWNPFVRTFDGELTVGERLTVQIQPEGQSARTFRPTVTEVVAGSAFEWLGRLGVPGVFDGRHRFELRPIGADSCELVNSKRFSGLLIPFTKRMLSGATAQGFVSMNEAFAGEVRARAA